MSVITVPPAVSETTATWIGSENFNAKQQFAFLDYDRPTVSTDFKPSSGLASRLTVNFKLTPETEAQFDATKVAFGWGSNHDALPKGVDTSTSIEADGSHRVVFTTDFEWGGVHGTNKATYSVRYGMPGKWSTPWINVYCTYSKTILNQPTNPKTEVTYPIPTEAEIAAAAS